MKVWSKLLLSGFLLVLLFLFITVIYSDINQSKFVVVSSIEKKEPITIRIAWWGGDARHQYTQEVIQLYEKQNKHVIFDIEVYRQYDDYWRVLAPQAASGELPDIIQIDTVYYAQYAGKQLFADLTPYFNKEIKIDHINRQVLDSGIYGDGNYGMSLGINSLGFQYDPAMLKKAGIEELPQSWTWDIYEQLAMKAAENGIYFDDGMRPEIFFAYYLRTKGHTLYNEDGTSLGYTDDALFEDFFSRLIRLVHSNATPTSEEKSRIKDFTDNNMTVGKQIGIWQWSNQYLSLHQALNRPMEIFPMLGPNMNEGLFLKTSMYFSIADTSKVKEEAAKFIDFWINDIEANKIILGERGVPVSSKVQDAIKPYLSVEQKQVFDYVSWTEQNSTEGDPVDPVGSAEIIEVLKSLWQKMEYHQITAKQAAIQFRYQANSILAKNKIDKSSLGDD